MKNNIKCVISFALGAGLGAFGGYKLFEYKLNKLILEAKEDEIVEQAMVDSIINDTGYTINYDISKDTPDLTEKFEEIQEARKELKKEKSETKKTPKRDYSTKKKKAAPVEPEVEKGNESDSDIDIIPPLDFDAIPGFNAAYWTLYNDGVMLDDNTGLIVISPMDYVGEDAYNAALSGEDTVCVRNFTTKTDYHVDRIDNPYYDDVNTQPDETID